MPGVVSTSGGVEDIEDLVSGAGEGPVERLPNSQVVPHARKGRRKQLLKENGEGDATVCADSFIPGRPVPAQPPLLATVWNPADCLTKMYFQVEDQINIPHCCIKCCHTICCSNQVEAGPIFSRHWIHSVPFWGASLDILGSARFLDFSGHVRCPSSLPKLTRLLTRPFPRQSSYLHVAANKLENSCHQYIPFINCLDFGFTSILVWFIYQIIHFQNLL